MSDSLTSRSSSESVAKLGEWFTSTSQHLSFSSSITSTPRISKHALELFPFSFSFSFSISFAGPFVVVFALWSICRVAFR